MSGSGQHRLPVVCHRIKYSPSNGVATGDRYGEPVECLNQTEGGRDKLLAKVGSKMNAMEQKLAEALHLGNSGNERRCLFSQVMRRANALVKECEEGVRTDTQSRLGKQPTEEAGDTVPEVKNIIRRPTLTRKMTVEEEHMGEYFVWRQVVCSLPSYGLDLRAP
ncbi:hypothetical protein NECAME_03380 [Necator americanus]|uniref:Uncharacterized protein n=1 Tax=Necator americanus TaxID=51031 RepID=W2T3W9_NECAM|nr:hypothetical protein NECAME_03380 [Necator americanus]ETN76710.1 hypothetical protein NECAME_03380 [Necator americanus]